MGAKGPEKGGADWDTIRTWVRYDLGFCQIFSFEYIFFEIVVYSFCFLFSHSAKVQNISVQ